jgi:hypothetical protein
MSTIGTRIRNGRGARLVLNPRPEQMSPSAESSPAGAPYRLLWSTGIVAVVLCIVAFVLWGINGGGILFDMLVALCV